ncbi:MAG: phosphomannose isomerase type II C-terminal cupin domain [Pseudomonadota bacterium]|jgi:mannose-6-phosphate isomerase-like protein (cupin superfamily)
MDKQAQGYEVGASDERPWGRWEVLAMGDGFAVKRITVAPGQILSLQMHHHRAEHWIILSGIAEVTVDGSVTRKGANETAFVPLGARHRIANPGSTPLVFIEVQTGERLEEADIVRFEDKYGRSA